MIAPTAAAVDNAQEFLRALSAARQVYGLYPSDHPNRRQSVRDLLGRARHLHDVAGDGAVLFATRHSFYLGPALMARASLSLYRLVEAFEQAGVEALEIRRNVGEADLDRFVLVLLGQAQPTAPFLGLALNRIRPDVHLDDEEEEASELRRSYALGLELLRETALRAVAGRPMDLTATSHVVHGLATQIARDPTQALLLTTVKSYDEYTYYHMVNVCLLTVAFGHAIGLHHDQVVALGIGALLHDVGKLNVPADVLSHVGPLSEEQWRIVQRHPVDGAGLVFGTREGLYHPAAPVVLEHHAAYDLSGYPRLSERPQPSLPARIVAVADCFDAVTSKRSYREAEERRQALNVLMAGAGRGFDPRVVRLFVRLLGVFPVGALVRLTTGEAAVVVRVSDRTLSRPVVRLLLDPAGDPVAPEEIDLNATLPDGSYRRSIARSLDPTDLDLDIGMLLTSGSLELAFAGGRPAAGLVHEPSPGEPTPPGYVDTHRHGHGHRLDGGPDPDVAPPFDA